MNEPPMEPPEHDRSDSLDLEIRRVCSVLERIAEGLPADSEERLAIRDAALAYTVVHQHNGMMRAFSKLRLAFGGSLSEEMKERLRQHGIDPDKLAAELANDLDAVPDENSETK